MSKYIDKNGKIIEIDDVLWDGKIHWSYCTHPVDGDYIISCEKGYNHNLSQDLFRTMSYVGKHDNCLHLFECD